jgi:hypothetical protein
MRTRKWTQVLAVAAILLVAGVGTVLAAPSAAEKPVSSHGDAATSAAAHGFLGIAIHPLNERVRAAFGVPDEILGVVVANVAPGSSAQEAGIERGNVITAADSQPITVPGDLMEIITGKQSGDEVELTVLQDGQETTITVTLTEPPQRPRKPHTQRAHRGVQKLYALTQSFPHLVDGELRLLDQDGNSVTYLLTIGSMQETGAGWLVVEKQTEEQVRFDLADESVVFKQFKEVDLGQLAVDDRVVVLTIVDSESSVVKAVVAGPFRKHQGRGTSPRSHQARPLAATDHPIQDVLPKLIHRLDAIQQHVQKLENRIQ